MCQKYRLFLEKGELKDSLTVMELTCLDKWSFKLSQKLIEKNLCSILPEEQQVRMLFWGCGRHCGISVGLMQVFCISLGAVTFIPGYKV